MERSVLTSNDWNAIYTDCETAVKRGMPWGSREGAEIYDFEVTTEVGGIELYISGFLKTYDNGRTFYIDGISDFEVMNDPDPLENVDYERELDLACDRCNNRRHWAKVS